MILLVAVLLAAGPAGPADLAPGAPDLQASERRLEELLVVTAAVQTATARLQVEWTVRTPLAPPKPKPGEKTRPKPGPCDDPGRLDLGWRIERFGAGWREAAQATRVEAERLEALRALPTISPLVDARWGERLEGLDRRAERAAASFLEASAWEERFVRPDLARCPLAAPSAQAGVPMKQSHARGETRLPVAVLATGDGWVCPQATRAEDAVVLVPDGRACWSASPTCGCAPAEVWPGAVLGGAEPAP